MPLLVLPLLILAGIAAPSAAAAGWSIQAAPSPSSVHTTELVGVSCISSKACTAVGYSQKKNQGSRPLAEHWNGTKWSIQKTPNPPGTKNSSSLDAVSCTSSKACTAVGSYINAFGAQLTFAERWNGTKWSIQKTPNPTGFDKGLLGVSCTSSGACIAVGSYQAKVNGGGIKKRTLAERWKGSKWSVQTTPNPSGTSEFAGVSCTSSAACTAVGDYIDTSGNDLTLAERWDGSKWSVQTTQDPGPGFEDLFLGVSCTSSNACTAAGQYDNGSAVVPLAERWSGGTWSVQSMPEPKGAKGNDLFGVSCGSGSACTAVGLYFTPKSKEPSLGLAEHWNGSKWSTQKTPNPTGSTVTSQIVAVSCTSSTACTAVGYDQTHISGPTTPLVERHS